MWQPGGGGGGGGGGSYQGRQVSVGVRDELGGGGVTPRSSGECVLGLGYPSPCCGHGGHLVSTGQGGIR